jgi:hypothetical protein
MNQLISTSRNITHSIREGIIYTEIEAVLGVEEPFLQYVNGRLMNLRTPRNIRFGMSIETADALLGDLGKWIEEAKQQSARLELKEATQ